MSARIKDDKQTTRKWPLATFLLFVSKKCSLNTFLSFYTVCLLARLTDGKRRRVQKRPVFVRFGAHVAEAGMEASMPKAKVSAKVLCFFRFFDSLEVAIGHFLVVLTV